MATQGSVAKITGKEGTRFEGIALAYDSEEEMLAALEKGEIKKDVKQVVIIRYEGKSSRQWMYEYIRIIFEIQHKIKHIKYKTYRIYHTYTHLCMYLFMYVTIHPSIHLYTLP